MRPSWLSFLSRRFSSSDDSLLPRIKSKPVSSTVDPKLITRSNPDKDSGLLAASLSSKIMPSTNLKGYQTNFIILINKNTLSKSLIGYFLFKIVGTHLGIGTELKFLIINKITIIIRCCSIWQISPVYETSHFNRKSFTRKFDLIFSKFVFIALVSLFQTALVSWKTIWSCKKLVVCNYKRLYQESEKK